MRRRPSVRAATLAIACVLAVAAVRAQDATEADATPQAAAPSQSAAPPAGVEVGEWVARVRERWIDPFVERQVGAELAATQLATLRTPLRALIGSIDSWLAAEISAPSALALRRSVMLAAREELAKSIAARRRGDPAFAAAADEVVRGAAADDRQRREDYLQARIICWCPKENFTRTLAGCSDACADEQKSLVKAWLDEGLSDNEVFERMVAQPKGGPKVLGVPRGAEDTGWFLVPFGVALGCVVLLVIVLRGVLLRGKAAARTRVEPAAAERGAPSEEEAATEGEDAAEREDDEWGKRIERELAEMED